jgi:SagB-type dehydrogenase family enzyme
MPGARALGSDEARAFHEATKHSVQSLYASRHRLDWKNRPEHFKTYPDRPRIPLPSTNTGRDIPALDAVATVETQGPSRSVDLGTLGWILRHGAGVRRRTHLSDGTEYYFRTYASAGALYPVEVYVVCPAIEGLEAGVYHFDPKAVALAQLRQGEHRGRVARAAAGEPAVESAAVHILLSGIPWRTAWKYEDRGYRHLFWDAGMIVANLLALAAAARISARVVLGFVDADVEALLGLDGKSEFPLCLLALGAASRGVAGVDDAALPPVSQPAPARTVPGIVAVNDAGRLADADAVSRWRSRSSAMRHEPGSAAARPEPIAPPTLSALPSDAVQPVIKRRGSARAFGRTPVEAAVLLSILDRSTRGVPTDVAPSGSRMVDAYFIANAVAGLAEGSYRYVPGGFVPLRPGRFRNIAGHLCLDQALGARAAATAFLMTHLDGVLESLGDRGYRVAQLEGGIVAGKMYLAAYGHRLGATGLTFYDDEVTEFFIPDDARHSCIIAMAFGESLRKLT